MRLMASTLVLTAAMHSLPLAAAGSPDWNYIEGSYVSSDLDSDSSGNLDIDGWEVAGAFQFFKDRAFVRGSYSNQDESLGSLFQDLELDILSVGLGARWPLADATDIYGDISYEKWRIELGSVDEDESGYSAGLGVRSVVWRGLELNGEVGYMDVGDFIDGEATFKLGGIYTFGIGLGIGSSYEQIDDLETWRFTLRYAFR